MTDCDLLILGGGASGLAAAIEAARSGVCPVVLERLDRVGKKILATGNGRCNLLNLNASGAQYNDPAFVSEILHAFDVESDLDFFRSMGLVMTADSAGRVYPRSMAASTVLDVLRLECTRLGVELRTGESAANVRRTGSAFVVNGAMRTKALIVACGGKAAPAQGSDGSGYPLLRALGHSVTALRPALVQIRTETDAIRPLKGLRSMASLTLRTPKGETYTSDGEILFADYGLSGIAAMDLSRHAAEGSVLTIDLLPDMTETETLDWLHARRRDDPRRPLDVFLTGLTQSRIGQTVLRQTLRMDLSLPCRKLDDGQLTALCRALKGFPLRVTGTKGFTDAQITAGGVPTAEFDISLASRKTPGLFVCGEILNVDGLCGGYNLTFAWSSGRLAARSAVQYIRDQG